MGLTKSSSMTGYSKIEQKSFSEDGFTSDDAIVFDGDKIISIMTSIKKKLGEISTTYGKIADLYGQALKCTASKKKMDTSTGDGKTMNSLKKKADARADVCKTRKQQLISKIESLKITLDAINDYNTQNLVSSSKDVNALNEQEND